MSKVFNFDIYKTMLNATVAPISGIRFADLRAAAGKLKECDSGTVGYAIGEMVLRATRYIEMTLSLGADNDDQRAIDVLEELRMTD